MTKNRTTAAVTTTVCRTRDARVRALADALSGVGAALVALWVFYPIDVWKTHVQAGRRPPPLRRMMSSGLQMKSFHTASSSFFYFYLYSWIVSLWTAGRRNPKVSVPARLLLSAIAAMINTCLTLPLDVVSARHQTMEEPSSKETSQSDSDLEQSLEAKGKVEEVSLDSSDVLLRERPQKIGVLREQLRNIYSYTSGNFAHLWKGLQPSLILCSNPAINYTVFDTIKSRYTGSCQKDFLSVGEAFLLGLFSKFVATIATYPLIRIKVMLMVTSENSMLECLRNTFRERGLKGLYGGCDLQLLHTLLKSALLMTVRERISDMSQRWIVGATSQ